MKREIKFRGKSLTGVWKYGSYVFDEEWAKHYIYSKEKKGAYFCLISYEIDDKSVSQYTGLKDRSGKEIYEGDIVKIFLSNWGKRHEYSGIIVFKSAEFMIDKLYDAIYKEPKCEYIPHNSMLLSHPDLFEVKSKEYVPNYGEVFTFSDNAVYVEVIGNIYEPPIINHAPQTQA